ncbi:hypothetical protein IW15_11920 [Chryseobacterium soli]|uniref:Uncharacterized protein n=1 Tax=Chryseobacterium soli TaxID=445961 RepID=A0A086A6E6_9FLAO|nr:hypothetical protein [Chryseobacterium soli]KFF12260.1 hypothetical protein IW15_11920 [Chryseobacterium soli]
MKKEILKQVRSDYEKLEIKPSADLWDRMEAELDKVPISDIKKPFQGWKYAAAILLLISFGAFFYFNSNKTEDKAVIATAEKLNAVAEPQPTVEIVNSNTDQAQHAEVAVLKENKIDKIKTDKEISTVSEDHAIPNVQHLAKEEIIIKNNVIAVPAINSTVANSIEKPVIAAKNKANYIKADELLLGREFDRTREENKGEQGKFGVLDATKIKFKSPNSLKILGVTVFSDQETK